MTSKASPSKEGKGDPPHSESRTMLMAVVLLLAFGVMAGGWYFKHSSSTKAQSDTVSEVAEGENVTQAVTQKEAVKNSKVEEAGGTETNSITPPKAAFTEHATRQPESPKPPRPEASAYTRAIVANLTNLDLSRRTISAEQAEFWKQEYQKLVSQGSQSVAGIRELLEGNINIDFKSLQNGDQLGATSLRMAMIDALKQIGGPESIDLMLQTMQTTASPAEFAALARNLQEMAPDQYTDAAVAAARATLARAAEKQTGEDMSPVFGILQKFGGAAVIPDLEQASTKWNYYGPLVLASLPDGSGVSSLARMAQDPNGQFADSSRFALRMLAQLAPQYPEAAQALVDDVRNGRIPDSAWTGIAAALGGETTYYGQDSGNAPPPAGVTDPKGFHLAHNNQNFNSWNVSPTWTPEQVQQQLSLVDQIAAANPTAQKMLDGVRGTLSSKLGK